MTPSPWAWAHEPEPMSLSPWAWAHEPEPSLVPSLARHVKFFSVGDDFLFDSPDQILTFFLLSSLLQLNTLLLGLERAWNIGFLGFESRMAFDFRLEFCSCFPGFRLTNSIITHLSSFSLIESNWALSERIKPYSALLNHFKPFRVLSSVIGRHWSIYSLSIPHWALLSRIKPCKTLLSAQLLDSLRHNFMWPWLQSLIKLSERLVSFCLI